MADSNSDKSAENAYAAASAAAEPVKGKLVDSLKADAAEQTPAVKADVGTKAPVAKKPAKKVAANKAVAKKTVVKKPVAKKATGKMTATVKKTTAKKAAPKPVKTKAAKKNSQNAKIKETTMTNNNQDYTAVITETMTDAVNELQTRAQAAYDKSTAAVADMTDFAKGNVEAVVESGKVMAEGMQALGKTYAEEAKTAYETATADLKEMAAVKSPTELFQLQGKILRRNFDAMIAAGTKNTDAAVKLASDVAAPLSGRVNVAAEKLSKVA